ncbi:MAG: SDR family NAD(P)-dependent oxidoreductase [Rhodospirillaceae bacterium]|nr:SDR family NAD(P)-dependent oxidoreductase [Rhodospirillaceae bacterium]
MSDNEFDGLNVVVSGGTGGLGRAVVDRLLGAGAHVFIPAFSTDEVERFDLASHKNISITPGQNLTDEAHVEAYYQGLPEIWASIHIAGGFAMAPLAETSKADFMRQMEMNALSSFLCSREAVKRMGAGGGRIVNIAARPALEPRTGAGMAAYTASKAAVAALTQALGEELAGDGILVNAVAPSILDTPPNRAAMADANFDLWPKVEEVAATIIHLASPENRVARSSVVAVYGKS